MKRIFLLITAAMMLAQCNETSFSERMRAVPQDGDAEGTIPGEHEGIDPRYKEKEEGPVPDYDERDYPKPDDGDNGGQDPRPDDPISDIDDEHAQVSYQFQSDIADIISTQVDIGDDTLKDSLVMSRQYNERLLTHQQNTLQNVQDSYVQGRFGTQAQETYTQGSKKSIDILLVVDNSRSMVEERVNLSTKLWPLISKIQDADWRLAFTTTDPAMGALTDVVAKNSANLESRFRNAILQPFGTGYEAGILQAVRSLRGDSGVWTRPGVPVAVIIVSDEDNGSDGTDYAGQAHQNGSFLVNYLASKYVVGATAKVHGLIWHPSMTREQCPTGYHQGKIYADVIAQSHGVWGSICDSDYTDTLLSISNSMAETLEDTFELTRIPDRGSLEIYFNGVLQDPSQFALNQRAITMRNPPPAGTEIRIIYRHSGETLYSEFPLSKEVKAGTLQVLENDQVVPPNRYRFDGKKVYYTPESGARLVLRYKENKELFDRFSLPGQVVESTLKVFVDGVEEKNYSYSRQNQNIVFRSHPRESAVIEIQYTEMGSPILSYAFSVNGQKPEGLKIVDKQSKKAISFLYAFGAINFPMTEYVEGRHFEIHYKNANPDRFKATLATEPVPGTIKVHIDNRVCNDVSINGREIDFGRCGSGSGVVTIEYGAFVGTQRTFHFDPQHVPLDGREIKWVVKINDQETLGYEQIGFQFEITDELKRGDIVTIQAIFKK
jgi:hypothetical protein